MPDHDVLAALDQIPAPLIGAAIARLAGRLLTAPDPGAADDFLTVADVAALLRMSKKAVYRHADALGVIRLNRRTLRFSRRAVDRFVARRSRR